MFKLTAALFTSILMAGCVAEQGRDNPDRDVVRGIDGARATELHGSRGLEAAELFGTGPIADARNPMSGQSIGLQLNAFYAIEIAEDPLRPTVLTPVGYIRRLEEDRGSMFMYEFYDGAWSRVAYMNAEGGVYKYTGQSEEFLGRFELDTAVRELFWAPDGYGYDSEVQDKALVNLRDPNVGRAEPRYRGVYHRTHRAAPPVVAYTLKRAGETGALAGRYEKQRYDEREEDLLKRLREERTGRFGEDGNYGGLRYKNGNPVDENDRPLKPGSK